MASPDLVLWHYHGVTERIDGFGIGSLPSSVKASVICPRRVELVGSLEERGAEIAIRFAAL